MADWIKKQDLSICHLQETHSELRHTQTESEGWKKIFHAKGSDRKVEVAILISDKTIL